MALGGGRFSQGIDRDSESRLRDAEFRGGVERWDRAGVRTARREMESELFRERGARDVEGKMGVNSQFRGIGGSRNSRQQGRRLGVVRGIVDLM